MRKLVIDLKVFYLNITGQEFKTHPVRTVFRQV